MDTSSPEYRPALLVGRESAENSGEFAASFALPVKVCCCFIGYMNMNHKVTLICEGVQELTRMSISVLFIKHKLLKK